MDKNTRGRRWAPVLGGVVLFAAGAAPAQVTLQGEVTLDYYVADVDEEGFEYTDAGFYVEEVANDGATGSGPLSLSGWATTEVSPAGAGSEIGYLPVGTVPGNTGLLDVGGTVPADDLAPGEYHAHVLLQDDDFPGTFEDARSLAPRLLWRGGLEAVGPLRVEPYGDGTTVSVDFDELRNHRLDSRITNDIELTLYATYGFGPASAGYTLCRRVVPGLYAGDRRFAPGFDCSINDVPDGDYTLHLDVAEVGGRGGYSTLSGPDLSFFDGRADGYVDTTVYVAGSLGPWLPVLLGAAGAYRRRRRG